MLHVPRDTFRRDGSLSLLITILQLHYYTTRLLPVCRTFQETTHFPGDYAQYSLQKESPHWPWWRNTITNWPSDYIKPSPVCSFGSTIFPCNPFINYYYTPGIVKFTSCGWLVTSDRTKPCCLVQFAYLALNNHTCALLLFLFCTIIIHFFLFFLFFYWVFLIEAIIWLRNSLDRRRNLELQFWWSMASVRPQTWNFSSLPLL